MWTVAKRLHKALFRRAERASRRCKTNGFGDSLSAYLRMHEEEPDFAGLHSARGFENAEHPLHVDRPHRFYHLQHGRILLWMDLIGRSSIKTRTILRF